MEIELREIEKGLPGITEITGKHLYEACAISLYRHSHNPIETDLTLFQNNDEIKVKLNWEDIFTEQLDRSWKDQYYATEHAAICISILLALKLTDYTVIERSARFNGFDYWLGEKGDLLFQKKARLEISGIFQDNVKTLNARYNVKVKQTKASDGLVIPAYIGIVELSSPMAKFGKR